MRICSYLSAVLSTLLILAGLCALAPTPAFSATPLPTEYYSPEDRYPPTYFRYMTFVIPDGNKLRQAVRTLILANKRQRGGINTVILFENTAVQIPVVQGIPFGSITTYTGENWCAQPMPECPKGVSDYVPPLMPDAAIPNARQIYLPLLKQLLLEHARLGGKIVLCPCCDRVPSKRITYLPKEVSPEKLERLLRKMKIKEGAY